MDDPTIRIPEEWLIDIANTCDKQKKWRFVSKGGNVLVVEKITPADMGGIERAVFDFEYNPGD